MKRFELVSCVRVYIERWSSKFALTMMAVFASSSFGGDAVTFFGSVKTEDGIVVKGGTLVFTEQRGRLFSMPDATIKSVTVTDKDGRFEVTFDDVTGDMSISLVRDLCLWKAESRLISAEKIQNGQRVGADLIAKSDKCEKK